MSEVAFPHEVAHAISSDFIGPAGTRRGSSRGAGADASAVAGPEGATAHRATRQQRLQGARESGQRTGGGGRGRAAVSEGRPPDDGRAGGAASAGSFDRHFEFGSRVSAVVCVHRLQKWVGQGDREKHLQTSGLHLPRRRANGQETNVEAVERAVLGGGPSDLSGHGPRDDGNRRRSKDRLRVQRREHQPAHTCQWPIPVHGDQHQRQPEHSAVEHSQGGAPAEPRLHEHERDDSGGTENGARRRRQHESFESGR